MNKEQIRESLRVVALDEKSNFTESKNVENWWDTLPGKKRLKVLDILGISKGRDVKLFEKLEPGMQAEISAYFGKYGGQIESVESLGEDRNSDSWVAIKKSVENYNKALDDLQKALTTGVVANLGSANSKFYKDAIISIKSRVGNKIKWR